MTRIMKKYYIKTFGCQMNVSDSERIASFLELHKFKPAKDINKADLIIFNTCGVRQMAEDRVYGQIHNLKVKSQKSKVKIILTGCLANRKDVQRRLKDKVDLFCEIKDFPAVIASACLPGRQVAKQSRNLKNCSYECEIAAVASLPRNDNYLSINPKYADKHTAYIPIMTGCNNFCSYCVVPFARGREISRPIEEIIKEINNLFKNGCKEITLLGQNVNSYKFTVKNWKIKNLKLIENCKLKIVNYDTIKFPALLDILASSYSRIKFRFLTSHPKDFSNELIKVIAKNKNISREIHLPVQAGSDKILKLMNRPYTQKKYLDLIQKIRKGIPDATFTTDVIVGFPGETKKYFLETVKVFKKVNYTEAYINKYSPRPGTAAWKLGDPIAWEEKKRREKILREIIKN
jgi:tRNA-2-methylthio-N6-dimethylallyladenosine synthase